MGATNCEGVKVVGSIHSKSCLNYDGLLQGVVSLMHQGDSFISLTSDQGQVLWIPLGAHWVYRSHVKEAMPQSFISFRLGTEIKARNCPINTRVDEDFATSWWTYRRKLFFTRNPDLCAHFGPWGGFWATKTHFSQFICISGCYQTNCMWKIFEKKSDAGL